MTRLAPSMVAREPWSCGQEMARTPANPISSPTAWVRGSGRRSSTTAQAAPANGTAPFSMPATDESIHCWATGNSSSGRPAQMTPRKTTRGRSSPPIGRRAAGARASAATPRATRATAIPPGGSASSPMSMNRYEDPQMRATLASSSHSVGPKDPGRLPRPVSTSRRGGAAAAGSLACRSMSAGTYRGGVTAEHLQGAVEVGLGVVQVRGHPQLPPPEGHVDPGGLPAAVQLRGTVGPVVAEHDEGGSPGALAGTGQPVAVGVEALEEPLDQRLVPGGDPVD